MNRATDFSAALERALSEGPTPEQEIRWRAIEQEVEEEWRQSVAAAIDTEWGVGTAASLRPDPETALTRLGTRDRDPTVLEVLAGRSRWKPPTTSDWHVLYQEAEAARVSPDEIRRWTVMRGLLLAWEDLNRVQTIRFGERWVLDLIGGKRRRVDEAEARQLLAEGRAVFDEGRRGLIAYAGTKARIAPIDLAWYDPALVVIWLSQSSRSAATAVLRNEAWPPVEAVEVSGDDMPVVYVPGTSRHEPALSEEEVAQVRGLLAGAEDLTDQVRGLLSLVVELDGDWLAVREQAGLDGAWRMAALRVRRALEALGYPEIARRLLAA